MGETFTQKLERGTTKVSRHGRQDVLIAAVIEAMLHRDADLQTALSLAALRVTAFNKSLQFTLAKQSSLEDYVRHLVARAQTDRLTGAQNREGVLAWLAAEAHSSEEICSILLDIDHFKKINDTYGHKVGDEALVQVAGILKDCARDADIVGRWGGEEFLCFVKAPMKTAEQVAERMRHQIESATFQNIPTGVTISIGVSIRRDHEEIDILIERTDKALYQAKSGGRNQVCTA